MRISPKNMLKSLKNRIISQKRNILVVVGCLIVCTMLGTIYNYVDARNNQSMKLSLVYSGAEKGLNPDGSVFSMSEILSDEVVESAVETLNDDGVEIDTETLRERLKVSGSMSDTVLDSAKAAINANEAFQSMPNTFSISYSNDSILPDGNTITILNAVADSYTEYFQKHHMEKTTALEYEDVSTDDYDYPEISSVISSQISSMQSYLSEKKSADSSFVSSTTGYSFADLMDMLSNITNLDLDKLKSNVKQNAITNDVLSYYNKLVTLKYMKNQDLEDSNNKQSVTEEAVKNYESEITASVFIPAYDSDDNYYMSKTKTGADYLVENAHKYSETATSLAKSISEYNELMDIYKDASNSSSTLSKKADDLIDNINEDLSELSELAVQTANDYLEESAKGYISFSVPKGEFLKTALNAKSMLKYAIIGALLGIMYVVARNLVRKTSLKGSWKVSTGMLNKKSVFDTKTKGTLKVDFEGTLNDEKVDFTPEGNPVITIWDLFAWLWKWKLLVIIASLMCTMIGYGYANKIQTYSASAYIKYEDSAISEGMTPDYEDFNKDEIITPSIISSAIEDIGLTGYGADQIRGNIKVSSVTPSYISEIKSTKTENGEEYEYNPVYYIVTITNTGDLSDMTVTQLRNLLDAILNEYVNVYTTMYVNTATVEAISFDTDKYDYLESADLISDNLDSVMESLQGYSDANSTYRSPMTGYTFSDLIRKYQNIENVDLPRLYSLIYNNKLAKDSDLLVETYKSESEEHTLSSESASRQVKEDKRLIDELVKVSESITNATTDGQGDNNLDNNQLVDDTDSIYYKRSTPLITYDELLNNYVDDAINAGQETLNASRCDEIVGLYSDGTPIVKGYKKDSSSGTDKAEKLIDKLLSEMSDLYEQASATLEDYNNYIAAQHITFVTGVKTYANVSKMMYMLIGGALAFMVSVVGCFTYEILQKFKKAKSGNF